jgi:hypothetical protein
MDGIAVFASSAAGFESGAGHEFRQWRLEMEDESCGGFRCMGR